MKRRWVSVLKTRCSQVEIDHVERRKGACEEVFVEACRRMWRDIEECWGNAFPEGLRSFSCDSLYGKGCGDQMQQCTDETDKQLDREGREEENWKGRIWGGVYIDRADTKALAVIRVPIVHAGQ